MKKFLRFLIISLGIIVLIIISAVSFVYFSGIPHYEVKKIDLKVESTPERVERGKKLALILCANCHKNSTTGKLTGEQMLDAPLEFGPVFSQNITQDKEWGIGNWTDGEIYYLLRTGIKRDGQYAPPYMVKLHHMADEDIYSIISFLHSDDNMVTASSAPDRPCEPSLLTKFLCRVAFKPLPLPDKKVELPDTSNHVALGKYLLYNLQCYACHSADFKTNDEIEPEKSVGFLGGGNQPLSKEGKPIITQNITPDKETGIGLWSEEKFIKALKFGIIEDQPALRYPMMPYSQLTDTEAKAIYAYLQTVSPINNKVPRSPVE